VSALALHLPIEDLLIPLSAYLQDRKTSQDIYAPYSSGRRAFSANYPFPKAYDGNSRLPRVLREATSFVLFDENIKTEGIFRVSAPAKVRDILKEAYDRGQKFIIWKEHGRALPLPSYPHAEGANELADEMDPSETYGVHLAASLIKLWYSDLKEPIVPQTAYRDLTRFYASEDPTVDQLIDVLSPHSEWSFLPAISREILTRHLLPLLSEVVKHKEENRMTSVNLAVCFAPSLVCGPDQMEDIKISNILRRILVVAIDSWPQLREIFAINEEKFHTDLQPPSKIDDYEDPLYERSVTPVEHTTSPGPADTETQRSGIIMKDKELFDSDQSDGIADSRSSTPPPLPPRSITSPDSPSAPLGIPARTRTVGPPLPPRPPTSDPSSMPKATSLSDDAVMSPASSVVRRKPAPPLSMPPRYSAVVGPGGIGGANELSDSPTSYVGPADGFGPPRSSGWSVHSSDGVAGQSPVSPASAAVKRKPVGSGDEEKGGEGKE
jgi:Rho GTPase-activating protein 1